MTKARVLVTVGVVALAVVVWAGIMWGLRRAERSLLERAQLAFDAVSLDRSVLSFDGRRAVLTGEVLHAADVARAEDVASRVPGVSGVTNNLTVSRVETPPPTATVLPTGWVEIRFAPGGALVRGAVAGDEDRLRLLAAARELAPGDDTVHDRLQVDRALERTPSFATALLVARLLKRVESGALRMDAQSVRIEAVVSNEGERRTLLALVAAATPGLAVDDRVTLANDGYDGDVAADPGGAAAAGLQRSIDAILAEQGLDFPPGSATVLAAAEQSLDRVAALLTAAAGVRLQVAYVTASDEGGELGRRRAEAVADSLRGRGVGFVSVTVAEGSPNLTAADEAAPDRIALRVVAEE